MEYKKKSVIWFIFWMTLILALVMFFPKSCGKTNYVSTVFEYNCQGIKASAPLNINSSYDWCYGICFEKSLVNETVIQKNKNIPDFLSGTTLSITKIFFIVVIIFILILFLKWIGGLGRKKEGMIVYKRP